MLSLDISEQNRREQNITQLNRTLTKTKTKTKIVVIALILYSSNTDI